MGKFRIAALMTETLDALKAKDAEIERLQHDLERYMGIANEEANRDRWIPVSERLPTEKGEYQVTFRHFSSGKRVVGDEWFEGKRFLDTSVIAWREQPEPYEGE